MSDLKARTKSFALQIIALYTSLPKSGVLQVLGKQVLRSGTSVGANYREACRSRSDAEFTAKLGDSLKELEEPFTGSNSSTSQKPFPTAK